MSSAIWDWVAALTGIRPLDNIFLPTYWCLPAELTVNSGWAPTPTLVLNVLIALSLLGCALYLIRRHSGYLHLSFSIWGLLLADTPYALLLPLTVWGIGSAYTRISKLLGLEVKNFMKIPWKKLLIVYVLAFLVVASSNFARLGVAYFPGYARNAVAAFRWDGGWHPWTVSQMDSLLDQYVAELAREAEGRTWIFTDGLCDSGIELKGKIRAVSLAGGSETEEDWRKRGFTREEDLTALVSGASGLLRSWAMDRPENLTNAVFQCGFVFLEKAAGKSLKTYGLVLRTGEIPEEERIRAMEVTRRLGQDILDFHKSNKSGHGGQIRNARFCAMQWRVSRAIRRFATEFDRQVRTREALACTALSEELDRNNPFARRQGDIAEAADMRAFGALTPREGLTFALRRTNFTLARSFAIPILKEEPENAEANFAMAMSHLTLGEHAQARHYFEIALKSRPNDAAILNNIAVASLVLGDLKDAQKRAQEALKLKPDSAEIKDTIRNIELRLKSGN